VLASVSV